MMPPSCQHTVLATHEIGHFLDRFHETLLIRARRDDRDRALGRQVGAFGRQGVSASHPACGESRRCEWWQASGNEGKTSGFAHGFIAARSSADGDCIAYVTIYLRAI
jgi:hypothetical protein